METELKLERATSSDVPAVAALMNRAFRGTGPTASWNTEAVFIEGDRTSVALLTAEMAARPNGALLLSRSDDTGELSGCVWLEPSHADVWYLGSLAIDPKRQNSGAGRRLLQAAETWAFERGARTIRMKVVNVRETLIAWYLRRGYEVTGKAEPFPYDDPRFGIPKRGDLSFLILEKGL